MKALQRITYTTDDLVLHIIHPVKKIDNPSFGWYAMALIVKSLRFRSSSRLEVNVTCFG